MNKISLVVQREYLTRVRKKSFLLTTFLVPLFFIGMYVGIIFLTKKSFDESHSTVYIVDQQGEISEKLHSNKTVTYIKENKDLQEHIAQLNEDAENTSILIIPPDFFENPKVEFLSNSKANLNVQAELKQHLSNIAKEKKFESFGINVDSLNRINSTVEITAKEISKDGETKESNTGAAMAISLTLSVLIYISLFLYGSQVMRGIIEEKNNRVIEVIISSVKPFELMMGKIVGIGLVGLTQFALWLILSVVLVTGASTFLISKEDIAEQMLQNKVQNTQDTPIVSDENLSQEIFAALANINLPELVICFFVFFLGGYLIYSALFAAVGSAVDSETEASQFTMPITMPLLLTYALSFGVLVNDPHGSVATWLSFIPFTSPIAMLVRIPFGVPTWQIIISASLLIVGFIFTTWVASRIYRVGILMYGKKASYKELIKWFKYKN